MPMDESNSRRASGQGSERKSGEKGRMSAGSAAKKSSSKTTRSTTSSREDSAAQRETTGKQTSKLRTSSATDSREASAHLLSQLGQIVRYYKDGWRYGTLRKLAGKRARVEHPITGPHWIPIEDVREV